jgi:hypothetical protein
MHEWCLVDRRGGNAEIGHLGHKFHKNVESNLAKHTAGGEAESIPVQQK